MTQNLRILHVASGDLWAGAEVQAFTLMSHLTQIPDTEVAAVLMNEGILADRLRSVGIPLYVFDEREVGPIRISAGLRGVLNDWRPDVIHTHREKENILGSLANRSCRNVPSVRTMHGGKEHSAIAGWRGARRRMVERLDRWCGCRLQQRIIAVTGELAARLRAEFPAANIVVIENGVDVDRVRAEKGTAEFRSAAPDSIHIGIVGRLVEVKRVDLFIQAAALLRRDDPQRSWRFHVFGDGPLRGELEALSERLDMTGGISFHGHRQDIATCIGGLDALVICSDHEGMPMAALEAAALEVPTVAHAVGGLVDIVPEALLVTRHDARGYHDGVLEAVGEECRSIARNRIREVLPRFSAKCNAERVHALYKQVIAECNGRYERRAG
jgi:L-malate glycosyltransferase